jgi:hypothetical protein
MIQTIDFNGFIDTVGGYGRAEQLGGYNGLRALYYYIEEMEADIGQQIELDVIGLCCEWSCYGTAVEAAHELLSSGSEYGEGDEDQALAALEHETTVLSFDGGILVREF